ncbi:hypothetical protein Dalk_1220 [Desulfatibacillum aliphaticivorans]|uniref:Uncharacterized protein n=1 Tax=Desulfatibacillum aliphaticivorans TaxID=218208 RepID=B8F9H7_DESAL|nr:hypothetical protein [Desulfatibacillum aliphaticivorans]ACL02923.1 hypothetical protein Dalk_1220 [Desulfatibacillum aliphaticivorans]
MQPTNRPKFSQLPGAVKAAMGLFLAAWGAFFGVQAALFGTISIIHITFAGLFGMLILSYRNIGRLLCAVYHLIMAAVLGEQAFAGDPNALFSGANALLFFLSTAFLLHPQTARLFKNKNTKNAKTDKNAKE